MPVLDTFSKRMKKLAKAGQPDVFLYTELPSAFRVQVIHIWLSAIGPYFHIPQYSYSPIPASNKHWQTIHDLLARERGVFNLGKEGHNPFDQCQQFVQSADTDSALDLIELSLRLVDWIVREQGPNENECSQITQDADSAIEELNHRFFEHSLGYQFVEGNIIRVDSEFIHSDVVRPALALLTQEKFSGASDEFLRAHEHYRKGRLKEAIADALKAFESVVKTICDRRGWTYQKNATASPLIGVLFTNGLIPLELQSHFSALRATLEAGVPTVRNKMGGHGQGQDPTPVPDYIAAYALHLTAANIQLLIEADRNFS